MKKSTKTLLAMLLAFLMVIAFAACQDTENGDTYALTVSDISVEVGSNKDIAYTLTPAGALPKMTYTVVTATPADCVRVSGGKVYGDAVGTATIKAKAENMPGATTTFSVEKNFTVTVTAIPQPEGEGIVNGGFENGFTGWTLTPSDPSYVYKNEVVDNTAHGGDYALNLWYNSDPDAAESFALNLAVSQNAEIKSGKTYLFSLWFKGAIGSVTLSLNDGTTVLITETFSGYDYKAPADNEAYVNYGIEYTAAADKTVTAKIVAAGDAGCWGYIDDVSLREGTLDDLITAPGNPEDGEYNFVNNGSFDSNSNGWTLEKNAGNLEYASGHLGGWNGSSYKAYQTINDLPARTYGACMYVIGEAATLSEASFYVKKNGTAVKSSNFEIVGWGSGIYARVEISDMQLSGDVEIGVIAVGSANFWINFDNITLWSEGFVSNDVSFTNITVGGVSVTASAPAYSVALTTAGYNALVAVKADARSLVAGTLKLSTVTAAVFNDTTDILTVTVTAQDGTTTQTYEIAVGIDNNYYVDLSNASDWTQSGTPVSQHGFGAGGIWLGNGEQEGAAESWTLTRTLTNIPAGSYTVTVHYGVKNAEITVNGNVETNWNVWEWKESSFSFVANVADGTPYNLSIKLDIGKWSPVVIKSIAFAPAV